MYHIFVIITFDYIQQSSFFLCALFYYYYYYLVCFMFFLHYLYFLFFFSFLIFPLARWSTKKYPAAKFLSLCFVLCMFIIIIMIIIILMEGLSYLRGTSTSNFMLFYYGFISSFFILINSCFIFFFTIAVMLFSFFFVRHSFLWSLLSTITKSRQPQDLKMLVFLSFLTWIF